jgi:hypothetical protein
VVVKGYLELGLVGLSWQENNQKGLPRQEMERESEVVEIE